MFSNGDKTMISKGDAILALVPNAQFNILNGEVTWLSDALVQPTEEAIVEKIAELEYLEGIESYKEDRAAAYPDWGNQLDYIYHNGVDSWKADIVDPVKTAHPKVNPDSSEIVTRKSAALAAYQLEKYSKAISRLAQYIVADGRSEVVESQTSGTKIINDVGDLVDITTDVITQTAIEALPANIEINVLVEGTPTVQSVANPAITKDSEERAAAQATVDATPQEVVDAYNV